MAYYSRPPRSNSLFGLIVSGIILLALFGWIFETLLPLLIIGGVGYGAYRLISRQARLDKATTAQRLQNLKSDIQIADRKLKVLKDYLANKEYKQYALEARQLLPKVQKIQSEANELREKMDSTIYHRVIKKAGEVETELQTQLLKIDITPSAFSKGHANLDALEIAPELSTVYNNIQRDHASILEKISQADNKEELTALHEANMQRFEDILTGYLKIKEEPKNYYNAEERLAQAKAALEKFDLDLDETLRQLNESDMKDFDVSLRMMNAEHKDYAQEAKTSDIY